MISLTSKLAALAFAALLCAAFTLLAIYPYRPASLIGWFLLISLSIPIVLLLELSFKYLLGNAAIVRLSSPVRIIIGVIGVTAACTTLLFAWRFIEPHLTKWH
jgi:hypothetical protein